MAKQTNKEANPFTVQDIEQTKEEFYKWFENKGLISDLRAYMRQLMVKALVESNKNENILQQKKKSTSPKIQAINLLVVDYLFHEDYLYTVSVFSSEAGILDSLPQYSQYVAETVRERRRDSQSLPRFSQQEAEDILDSLHLPSSPHTMQQAIQLYLSTAGESLFTCVVRTLASHHNHNLLAEPAGRRRREMEERMTEEEVDVNHQLWSEEMQNLLLMAGVKLQHIRRLQQRWAKTIEEERLSAKKEAEEKEKKANAEKEDELRMRLKSELEEQMKCEQEALRVRQSRVEMREQGLANLADQLGAVHDDINDRLSQLQIQKEDLRLRELQVENEKINLEDKWNRLLMKQENISSRSQEGETSFAKPETKDVEKSKEFETVKEHCFTEEVGIQTDRLIEVHTCEISTQTTVPELSVCTQTINIVDSHQQTSPDISAEHQFHTKLQTEREKINELLEENMELRAFALQQRQRIDELTNRAASLSAQLEESQVAVTVLSGREEAAVAMPAPPAAPPFVPTFGFNTPQTSGAGEESLFVPRPPQTTSHSDHRRRSLRFSFSHNPSATSEESTSPTGEIIQNARARIRQLGEESAAVQRNYEAFRSRLLLTDSVMFPPLGAPRTNNPVLRVRRNDLSAFTPFVHHPYSYANNFVSQQPRPRVDNDDSSSDRGGAYESSRIESLTHARRLFTQRNIRQFERWKQFKKKFQKKDVIDQIRRKTKQNHSNTSSEDEVNVSNSVHPHEQSKSRQKNENNTIIEKLNHTLPCASTAVVKDEQFEPKDIEGISSGQIMDNTTSLKDPSINEIIQSQQQNVHSSESILQQNTIRSEKLIESLKILLNDQKTKRLPDSTNVESLIEDSKHISRETAIEPEKTTSNKSLEENINEETDNSKCSPLHDEEEHVSENLNVETKEQGENVSDTQKSQIQALIVPKTSLMEAKKVNSTANIAFHTTAGNKDGQEEGTSSVSSGSDIIRELNPSHSDSTTSISVGLPDSKHSSDFWE